jgi:signal transduction histidine kinase
MTIKSKISLYISLIFTILFGIISFFVITIFSDFRKQEFEERLKEKALTSIKLLIEVKEVDNSLLKIIDQNSINKLYNEKTLIFDVNYQLIYSSLDDTKINWSKNDLDYLKKKQNFFKKDGENEVYGFYYDSSEKDYFALISAQDNYGKRKLNFLIYLLIGAYIVFTVLTWITSFYIIKNQLRPLDIFHKTISNINEGNLESQLEIKPNSRNEIDLLSNEFNFMVNRIANAYLKQKEFTSQASHELRTPVARIFAQLENKILTGVGHEKEIYGKLLKDIYQLNELINSLLILSKIENKSAEISEKTRIDEALYNSIETVTKQYPDFRINLNIDYIDDLESLLEINCKPSLLEIAFVNLLKNAYLYSENQSAEVKITTVDSKISVIITNHGETLSGVEQTKMFEPFMRGGNSRFTEGLGLGLRIVHRILKAYGYMISYKANDNENTFTVLF